MSRTVAALYDSRAEAERARSLLLSEVKARSPRILAKDTVAALDGMKIPPDEVMAYRESLRRGCHLVVAEVPRGSDPQRIIEMLEHAVSAGTNDPAESMWGSGEHGVEVKLPGNAQSEDAQSEEPQEAMAEAQAEPRPEQEVLAASLPEPQKPPLSAPPQEERIPVVEEQLRVGKRRIVGAGVRLQSRTREAPAEEQVSLRDESVEVGSRPSQRELSENEIEAAGLFTERVFEIPEMREEPVVTKTAVVREEVIIRRRVSEHVETIRDTVRHTEVEVEDLPAPAA